MRSPIRILKAACTIAVAACAGLASSAHADQWGSFQGLRAVAAEGSHYVVVSADGRFSYVRAKSGAPRLEPSLPEGTTVYEPRAEDTVLASGKLAQLPLMVAVSSRGKGFAAVEKHANVGYGDAVVLLDGKGTGRASLRLSDLFSQERIKGFEHSVSSIWWVTEAWVDDAVGTLVLLAADNSLTVVNLATAVRRDGGSKEMLAALRVGLPSVRQAAAEWFAWQPNRKARAELFRILAKEAEPLGLRLRAGVALKALGDDSGRDLVLKTATGPAGRERVFAVSRLSAMMGADAIPTLRDKMRGKAGEDWGASTNALAALGEGAVDALVGMLQEKGESPDYRGGAAHALGEIKSPRALVPLLAAVEDESDFVANAAVNAAIATGGPKLSPAFFRLLSKGSTQDTRIASYFLKNPDPGAARPLKDALARHVAKGGTEKDDYALRLIVTTLETVTGQYLGADVEAWRKWLDRGKRP